VVWLNSSYTKAAQACLSSFASVGPAFTAEDLSILQRRLVSAKHCTSLDRNSASRTSYRTQRQQRARSDNIYRVTDFGTVAMLIGIEDDMIDPLDYTIVWTTMGYRL